MLPALGLILTSAPSLAAVRAALSAARADTLKIVPAWGLAGGWTPAAIAEAGHLAPRLIVRTSWGDPSYAGGARRYPEADQIAGELTPWLAARPDLVVELGNEPLITPQPDEAEAWRYLYHLGRAIDAVRAIAPRATILGPAQMINHPVALGGTADGVSRWLAIAAPTLRRCDGLSLHAYAAGQLTRGLGQLRQYVSASMPVWLTEFALNEAMAPAERVRRYRDLLADAPVAVACLYHLNQLGGADPVHHNPTYDLDADTLAALGAAAPEPTGPAIDTTTYRKDKTRLRPGQGYGWRDGRVWRAGRPGGVTTIVIHTTNGKAGSAFEAEARFLRDSPDVSAHYLVGKAGQIAQILPDGETAWHAGACQDGFQNEISLGIECHLTSGEAWAPAQRDALTALVRSLMAAHQIGPREIATHRAIALPPGRKTDPAGWSDADFAVWRNGLTAEPWAAWGTAYPLPIAQRSYGIPQTWLSELLSDRPLGAATTPELGADGYAARAFTGGVIVWYAAGNRVEVRR